MDKLDSIMDWVRTTLGLSPNASIPEIVVTGEFIWVWCTGIGLYFSLCVIKLVWNSSRLNGELKKAAKLLKGYTDTKAFGRQWEEYDKNLQAMGMLKHTWSELSDSLIYPESSDPEPEVRNTREPAWYINDELLTNRFISMRFFSSVPNHLTALGILGTFSGLAAGITLAASGLGSSKPDEVQLALTKLLDGAGLAFITSIIGLSSSLVFLFFERFRIRAVDNCLDSWIQELERLLVLVTPESLAQEQLEQAKQQTQALTSFNTDLIFALEQALEEKVAGKLSPLLENLITAVNALRDDRQESNDAMLKNVASSFRESMTASAGSEIEAMASTLGALTQNLEKMVEQFDQSRRQTEETMTTIASSVQATLSESSRTVRENLEHQMKNLSSELRQGSQDASQVLADMAQQLRNASISGADEMQSQLRDCLREVSDEIRKSTEQTIRSLDQSMTETQSTFSNQVQAMAESSGHATRTMQTGMQEASSAVSAELLAASSQAAGEIGDALGDFKRSTELLHSTVDAAQKIEPGLERVTDNLGRTAQSLDGAHENILLVTEPLTEAVNRIRELGANLTQAANHASKAASETASASGSIAESSSELSEQWASYEHRFEGLDQSLESIFSQMDSGLARYLEQIQKFSRELDSETAKTTQALAGVLGELSETLESLEDQLGSTGRGRVR